MTKRRDFTQKQVLRAVHESDLEQFLDTLGLLQEIDKGTLKCYVCGQKITKTYVFSHSALPLSSGDCSNPQARVHAASTVMIRLRKLLRRVRNYTVVRRHVFAYTLHPDIHLRIRDDCARSLPGAPCM